MELVPGQPNVELRAGPAGEPVVVLSFPYQPEIVDAARRIPDRRFDWETREWSAPATDWAGAHVADILARFPELEPSVQVSRWLSTVATRWTGSVTAVEHDGACALVLRTRIGTLPGPIAAIATEVGAGEHRVPCTEEAAEVLSEERGARFDARATRAITYARVGLDPPPAVLEQVPSVDGPKLRLAVVWRPALQEEFLALPGADVTTGTLPADPYLGEVLDTFLARHGVAISAAAIPTVEELRTAHADAREAIERSVAQDAPPLDPAPRLGGTLRPFQIAGVRYLLDHRRAFLADEQGLGKTVQALAALEADGAFPAVVVCPASLKLTWAREAGIWLGHRSVQVLEGRSGAVVPTDITIVNYDVVDAHAQSLMRLRPRALVLDECHYVKNPRAKRTRAVRRVAEALPKDALRLGLSGTPVLNHPDELISQLRVLGRLNEFGSGARFHRLFEGTAREERLHWHLRRHCFVRRLKRDVLPQLPEKERVVVPVELANRAEYARAEEDVIAWLREQPLDLSELEAKVAAALRAERLAQLGALRRLAARGKLPAALGWIADFRQSGAPLVVFAHHVEVLEEMVDRFPDALHLLGRDSGAAREDTVAAFQAPDGPGLLIASTGVAAQGLTLTRATQVAFLELEWTPALMDQAEDRLHRIGQRDAVTAWYLLAAHTIDEDVSRILERKRGIVGAVTDGRADESEGTVEAVVRSLRERPVFRRLRDAG
jgi:SWI/SNF-related matrix-associated actin-dependent regulator 1 of chromatin subfamily A